MAAMRQEQGLAMKTDARRKGAALVIALTAGLVAGITVSPADAYEPADLPSIEVKVEADHAKVTHLAPDGLEAMLADKDRMLLIDVREEEEFRVSRIPGAIRVDPGTWSWTFLARHGQEAAGKAVVFYCSVGVRSSKLAASVQEGLKQRGAVGVYNLRGGIFRWHNESRALAADRGATDLVHPYDDKWGGLVARKPLSSRTPR